MRIGLRALLDSGATHSFIKTEWVDKWHLKQLSECVIDITTFGQNSSKKSVQSIVEVDVFKNTTTPDAITMKFISLNSFIDKVSCYKLTQEQHQAVVNNGYILADTEADSNGTIPIDMLIGQDFYHALQGQGEVILPGGLILTPSRDGKYILGGTSVIVCNDITCKLPPNSLVREAPSYSVSVNYLNFKTLSPNDEQTTADSFCKMEALGIGPLEEEAHPMLEQFEKDTTYDGKRYTVKLPLKENFCKRLSANFPLTFSRFEGWLKKHKNKKDKSEYEDICKIMKEQLDTGILEKVEPIGTVSQVRDIIKNNPRAFDKLAVEPGSKVVHYIPWHAVIKKGTTKRRIVYDAKSRPAKTAYSLNDCLETGPDLMNSLYHILLRFRRKRYACKADIEKAFLQVEIAEENRDALRLLWEIEGIVWILRFARLPFGLTCSSYLLAAVLQKHLKGTNLDKELIDQILIAFYVDDNIWSVNTIEELFSRFEVTLVEFAKAGMNIRQWNANSEEARALFRSRGDDPKEEETVLGLKWNVKTDLISINAERIENLVGRQPKSKRMF